MLVLSRKVKQGIVIGENIELVVVAVTGDRVKLGFNAPSEVNIHREEVHRRIQSENGAAAADGCGATQMELNLKSPHGSFQFFDPKVEQ